MRLWRADRRQWTPSTQSSRTIVFWAALHLSRATSPSSSLQAPLATRVAPFGELPATLCTPFPSADSLPPARETVSPRRSELRASGERERKIHKLGRLFIISFYWPSSLLVRPGAFVVDWPAEMSENLINSNQKAAPEKQARLAPLPPPQRNKSAFGASGESWRKLARNHAASRETVWRGLTVGRDGLGCTSKQLCLLANGQFFCKLSLFFSPSFGRVFNLAARFLSLMVAQ